MAATPPPAGWYPDPEAAGRSWRWWDGARWAPPGYGYAPAFDPSARAQALAQQARTSANTGKWLQWAMAGNAVVVLAVYAGFGVLFHAARADWFSESDTTSTHAGRLFVVLAVAFPVFELVSLAFFVLLVAWIYHAAKFGELQGWPAARGCLLGSLSLLIPIVQFWWPYEAVRDSFPPGQRPPSVLHWWLAYLIVPVVTMFGVAITALSGSVEAIVIALALAVPVVAVPVVLGWRLIDALDAAQRASLPG
jgi:hypothetical protein